MLPGQARLTRSQEFASVMRGGRRAGRPLLVVHLRRADGDAAAGSAKAGFVTSKAVGNAVVRNQVRRRLRHLMAVRLAELPAGSLVVVRALPSAAAASSDQLGRDLDRALLRVAEAR